MAAACGSDSSVSTAPSQVKCHVTLASSAATIGPDGGRGELTITAAPECPWDAASAVSWLTALTPTSGQGAATVAFRAAPNPAPSSREGEIVVNDARLRVAQDPAPCHFDVQPANLTVGPGGGTHTVTVSVLSGCTWTPAADVPWIRVAATAAPDGSGTITVDVAAHDGVAVRSGAVVVANRRVGVTQDGVTPPPPPPPPPGPAPPTPPTPPTPPPTPSCSYGLPVRSVTVGAAAASGAITVSASGTCAWTAVSTASWLAISAGASGHGPGVVSFDVAANDGPARAGNVIIAGLTFTVSQAGAAPAPAPVCAYTLDAASAALDASGGRGRVAVSAPSGCAWTANSGAGWVTIASGGTGSGNGSVSYDVAANSGAARSATLTIAGQTFTVTQSAAPPPPPVCTYAITPAHVTVKANKASTQVITVTTAAGCAWTSASHVNWITIAAGATGTGTGAVAIDVSKSPGKRDRTGTLTVAGHTFTVFQKD